MINSRKFRTGKKRFNIQISQELQKTQSTILCIKCFKRLICFDSGFPILENPHEETVTEVHKDSQIYVLFILVK